MEENKGGFYPFLEKPSPADALFQGIESGISIQELLNISSERLEDLYTFGYQHFQHQEYEKAQRTFALLTFLGATIPKYWWALGGVQVALNDFSSAKETYKILTLLEPENPQAYFFLSFCKQQLGERKEAEEDFQKARRLKEERDF